MEEEDEINPQGIFLGDFYFVYESYLFSDNLYKIMRIIKVTEDQFNQLNEVRYINTKQKNYISDTDSRNRYIPNRRRKLGFENNGGQNPIKNNEKIRVFHGCSMETALEICTKGTSGKVYHPRTYTYETGMNPLGIFVTVKFEVAKNFGHNSNDMCILEFTVNSSDLETPVWNGKDSYFVQGENPMPFNNSKERKTQKAKYDNDALNIKDDKYYDIIKNGDITIDYSHIRNSDKPAMANNIFNNIEHQALFMGDLNPNMVKYVWVRKRNENQYVRYTEKDFLLKFKQKEKKKIGRFANVGMKAFRPNEDVNSFDDAIQKIAMHRNIDVNKVLKNFKEHDVFDDPYRPWAVRFIQLTFWPKQIIQLFGRDYFNKNFNRLEQDF